MLTMETTAIYRTPSCAICGRESLVELPAYLAAALSAGAPAQDVLPEMPRADREQLISGTHPDCRCTSVSRSREQYGRA